MIITCERCSTSFVLADELVSAAGTPVQCTRCQHTFLVMGARPPFAPPGSAPGPLPRRHAMFFGSPPQRDVNALPDPTQPQAESYRSAEGRMTFGTPITQQNDTRLPVALPVSSTTTMVFGVGPTAEVLVTCPQCGQQYRVRRDRMPPEGVEVSCIGCGRRFQGVPDEALGPPTKPVAPVTPLDPFERMLADAADHLDDEQKLLVLSDALMEQGDPRGRLIAFMLEEERQSDLMRKVKVNVLTRDHAPKWAPPGARITGFHRGFPVDLEWTGPTDPHHLGWRSVRSLHVTIERVPRPSVFDVLRPQLRRVTGLNRALFTHVVAIAPAGLEAIDGRVHTDELLTDAARTLSRMPRLRFATLRTTQQPVDARLSEQHLTTFLTAAGQSGLKGVRLSMPRLSAGVLDRCLAVAPSLTVHFVIPFEDFSHRPVTLGVDPRRRLLLTPPGMYADDRVQELGNELSALLGERLSIVQASTDR